MSRTVRRLRRYARWVARGALIGAAIALLAPAAALAVVTQPTLAVNSAQLWALVIGALTPGVGYLLNHFAPWVAEPVKAGVQVALAAVAATVYSAIATHTFGWNTATAELVLSGVLSSLVAHKILWLPSGISALLGGGSSAQTPRRRRRVTGS